MKLNRIIRIALLILSLALLSTSFATETGTIVEINATQGYGIIKANNSYRHILFFDNSSNSAIFKIAIIGDEVEFDVVNTGIKTQAINVTPIPVTPSTTAAFISGVN